MRVFLCQDPLGGDEEVWIRCGIKFTELMDSHVFCTSNVLLKQFMTDCEMCWRFGVIIGKFWKARTTNAYNDWINALTGEMIKL